ncbi:MAG: D-alanyl-D-alanine carboxypeptidase / D-alanyl-D-alanine-endopeptidase [Nitrospirae bacterium]|nr:MAG: D-alanyl-D-alanine carboxypeptidase / D-alanyl-D-alanine-endopeptidase [Nitrospirota bacterium]
MTLGQKALLILICLISCGLLVTAPSAISAASVETSLSVKSLVIKDSIQATVPANAKWSFAAVDVDTHRQLSDEGNSKNFPLTPGSLVKLFITAAIFDMNSREQVSLDTFFSHDGNVADKELKGSIYIKGSGNAFLSKGDISKAVDAIISRDITQIAGDIIIDDTLFELNEWKPKHYGPAYSTPSPLGLDMHTVSITISGSPPDLKIDPPNDLVKVITSLNGKPDILQIDDLTYSISGFTGSIPMKKRFPLKNPSLYLAQTFKTLLRENNITFKGTIRNGKTPSGASLMYAAKSKSLEEIVKDINNHSLNVLSENLLLILGAKKYGPPGTIEKGSLALKEFLNNIGLSSEEIIIADGSGLSPLNRISANHIVSFLTKISEKPWFNSFYESLPRVGMEGTLKGIAYTNDHIRAKTGQLDDVYCLAGYIEKKDGKKVAFSYMVNVPGADLLWKENKEIFMLLSRIVDE